MAPDADIPAGGPGRLPGGMGLAGLVVAVESAALLVLTAIWAAPTVFAGGRPVAWVMWAGLVVMFAELATLLMIPRIRAVAAQTFHQCVRTKIAVTFIVLLAACLATLPMILEADGTLAGKIRALLSWGTSITAVLLGLVTIFLTASVVSSDVRDKQIFITATKPISRWQYLLGRWLGVLLMVGGLLAVSSIGIYAYAQYLREQEPLNDRDRLAVETEVFAARGRIQATKRPLIERIEARIRRMKEADPRAYRDALDAFGTRTRGDEKLAKAKLLAEITRQEKAKEHSRGYGAAFFWRFAGLRPKREPLRGAGTVTVAINANGWLRVRAGRAIARQSLPGRPIEVIGRNTVIGRVDRDVLVVRFHRSDRLRRGVVNLKPGDEVDLVLVPIIQVRFKATASGKLLDNIFRTAWSVGNSQSGYSMPMTRQDASRVPGTLTVSARAVGADGNMEVLCINNTPDTSIKIDTQDVFVLFPVGSFEWNYVRAVLLVMVQLTFLAACGIFAGSILSFPVACLVCFSLLPFSLMRGFLSDSLKLPSVGSADALTWSGHYAMEIMKIFLPDFAGASGGDALVDGLYIPWTHLGESAAVAFGARTLCVLAVACLLFGRRELAKAQV